MNLLYSLFLSYMSSICIELSVILVLISAFLCCVWTGFCFKLFFFYYNFATICSILPTTFTLEAKVNGYGEGEREFLFNTDS